MVCIQYASVREFAKKSFILNLTFLSYDSTYRCRPFAKFLCIKGVVFMTFWQGLAITILAETTDVGGGDAEEWAMSAQNFLICLEMLLFSIAHFYCFPTEEWEENYKVNYNKHKFGDSIALGDFFADLKLVMKGGHHKRRKKKPSEPTVPEGDEENADMEEQYDSDDETQRESTSSETTGNIDDLEEAKRVLTDAIENNISEFSIPELENARQRILASDFLNDMAFMSGLPPAALETEKDDEDSEEEKQEEHGPSSWHSEYGAIDSNDDEKEEATERTGLLSGDTPAAPLRPSIFTTIASMSDNDESFDDQREGL